MLIATVIITALVAAHGVHEESLRKAVAVMEARSLESSDLILFCVKSNDTESTGYALGPALRPHTIGWLAAVTRSELKLSPLEAKQSRSNSGSVCARMQKPWPANAT